MIFNYSISVQGFESESFESRLTSTKRFNSELTTMYASKVSL